ncbi:MAG: hypothetical protein ACRDHK_10370 [Actinomycetota bacterium]
MSASLLVGLCLLQTVWVVDDNGGPGVDFTDIQPAINAAADGDVLLVAPGTFSHFALTGKGLRILGSGSQSTFVSLPGTAGYKTQIASVPSGHIVHLQGINFSWPLFPEGDRLVVTGATTQVVLLDSTVVGSTNDTGPHSALLVEDAEVQIHRSTLASFNLAISTTGSNGGRALTVRGGARVHVSSSLVQGGKGGGSNLFAPPGGPAIVATDTPAGIPWLWIADSAVIGGAGGYDIDFGVIVTGTGGVGIAATNAHVRISGDSTSLVQGGASPTPSSFGSGPGPGISASGSFPVEVHSVPVFAGAPSTPATVGPVLIGAPPLPVIRATGSFTLTGSGTFTLSNGPASAPFALVLEVGPAHFGIPGPILGEVLVGPPAASLLALGALDPTGSFSLTVPLAGLPPEFAYLPFHLQGAALDCGGTWRLTNSVAVILHP